MDLVERLVSKTPPFFKRIRRGGILLGIIGGVLVTISAPISLPILATIGTVATALGGAAAAVASVAVDEDELQEKDI